MISLDGLKTIRSDFLSLSDIARIMGMSTSTVRKWVQEGNKPFLPHSKIGGSYLIHRKMFIHFLNSTTTDDAYIDPGYQGKKK